MSEQSQQRVVIAGAGLAGVQTAVQLREQGWEGAVTLLGAEPHRPYDRPPLSKDILLGKAGASEFEVDFRALGIELLTGCPVTALRPADREVDTPGGPVGYDHCVLATGAEPLALPGTARDPDAFLLRTLDDAHRLRRVLDKRRDVVAVGAGWIGAEFATAARAAGCRVTVVEAAAQPLAGALPAAVTEPMRQWYADAGAELLTSRTVTAVRKGAVELADGRLLPADAALIGIGSRPATAWLTGSGIPLTPDGSVRADARLRAGVPGVHAVGDCASFPSARYGSRMLVHHWDNALQGPRTVAAGILGRDALHDPVPYFWSEQFGRTVQYAGHRGEGDELVWRGSPADASWSVCWLRDGVLRALLAVDRPRDLAQGRRLIERATALDQARAADPAVPLKSAAR
ncbi:FAD-dependent oxidoreductase [Streptomyces sp. ACA25]|uniref:NAD(P)/FAD-dependent oxidoreductase n=1 Tax=Streptomyces sp. ACA25 TaxID=3022596 RepID=UPI00230831A2|nr:FAD-dependent oxidoreductase [Streptomyces sp. ACA25]MDB1089886.1 FAD-dependent oxidoreductase [Streptomyces sp. ACA25]